MSHRFLAAALALLAGFLVTGCYQTYDPYTGYCKYWPDSNYDYVNDLQPPVDPAAQDLAPPSR